MQQQLSSFFISLLTAGVFAATVTVSGTVTNQNGQGVANVQVTATAPGGSTVLHGPATTDSGGAYQLDVESGGTYDIHFTPPANSIYQPFVANNLTVEASEVLNVSLITSSTRTYSGTVRKADGTPASSVRIVMRNSSQVF